MIDQSDSQHNGIHQGGMLISGRKAFPVSGFQAEVSFGPGEMAFNDRAEAHVKTPLADKEQSGNGFLATTTQIVIDNEACTQYSADEIHDWISEVTGIGTHDGYFEAEA